MKITLAEKIAVMQAAEEGQEIEITVKNANDWTVAKEIQNTHWNWQHFTYRVKKSVRELYVNYYARKVGGAFSSLEVARQNAAHSCTETVHFVEADDS